MMSSNAASTRRAPLLVTLCIAATLALAGCAGTSDRQSAGELLENEALVAKVKTELAQRDLATLLDVEVESFRNVVQLSGFVDTEEEKQVAGEAAASVEGVEEVDNALIVKAQL